MIETRVDYCHRDIPPNRSMLDTIHAELLHNKKYLRLCERTSSSSKLPEQQIIIQKMQRSLSQVPWKTGEFIFDELYNLFHDLAIVKILINICVILG